MGFFSFCSADGSCSPFLMKTPLIIGVNIMATTNETLKATATAMGRARMNSPHAPLSSKQRQKGGDDRQRGGEHRDRHFTAHLQQASAIGTL